MGGSSVGEAEPDNRTGKGPFLYAAVGM